MRKFSILVATICLFSICIGCAKLSQAGAANGDASSTAKAFTKGEIWVPQEGNELIGKPAPEFAGLIWLNSKPFSLKSLRGKIVLIRFWLVDCPFCQVSAPALIDISRRYATDRLLVIGIHHPKTRQSQNLNYVRRSARALGFRFPIAHDANWQTIDRFWTGKNRSYTSASLLIDRDGKFAWVHDGGELRSTGTATETAAYRSLIAKIDELVKIHKPGARASSPPINPGARASSPPINAVD